jgi:hypothetical protein
MTNKPLLVRQWLRERQHLREDKKKQEVFGRTNLPNFPMAMVAIVTFAKDCM